MDSNNVADKNMSLDDLIKRDKMKKKPTNQGGKAKPAAGIRGKMQKVAANKMQGAQGRFGAKDFRGQ